MTSEKKLSRFIAPHLISTLLFMAHSHSTTIWISQICPRGFGLLYWAAIKIQEDPGPLNGHEKFRTSNINKKYVNLREFNINLIKLESKIVEFFFESHLQFFKMNN